MGRGDRIFCNDSVVQIRSFHVRLILWAVLSVRMSIWCRIELTISGIARARVRASFSGIFGVEDMFMMY